MLVCKHFVPHGLHSGHLHARVETGYELKDEDPEAEVVNFRRGVAAFDVLLWKEGPR